VLFRSDAAPDAVVRIISADGAPTETPNPYRDASGQVVVPVVSFASEDEDSAGYWVRPDEMRKTMQARVNLGLSDNAHTERLQGSGIPVSETVQGVSSPESWAPNTVISRDELLQVPVGRTLDFKMHGVDLEALRRGVLADIALWEAVESLPVGSAINNGTDASSGIALKIKTRSLTEHRQDMATRYAPAVQRLLDLCWVVWTHHHPKWRINARPAWAPGALGPPVDEAEALRTTSERIRMGLDSPVEVIARERRLSLDEAREVHAQNLRDAQPRPTGAQALAGLAASLAAPAATQGGGNGTDDGDDETEA
jgi:hypothetical protein